MRQPAAVITTVLHLLLPLVTLAYPFVWYFGRDQLPFAALALLMAAVWAMRALLQTEKRQKIVSLAVSIFFVAIIVANRPQAMYWYPVWVSVLLLVVFAGSLFTRQSIIERLARLQQPDLPPQGVRYTRRVTQIWCAFFIINGSIITALILTENHAAWTWYTGIVSYVLMGILFAGEYAYRRWVLKLTST
ncbi:MAG: hypothetical protein Q4G42_00550 [Neisseria sp.]|nr:hypothetical protein [Neisseria sp.]